MGLRVKDANRDLSEYQPLLSMITDLSKKAKLSNTNLPFVIDFLDNLVGSKNKQISSIKTQLNEYAIYKEWVLEFFRKHDINPNSTPEYSKNPIIEYCAQINDFRECDNVKFNDLKQQFEELTKKYELASLPMGGLVDKARNLEKQLKEKEEELDKNNDEWREICDDKLETINRLIDEKHEFQQQLEDKERHLVGQNILLNKAKDNNKKLKQELKEIKKKASKNYQESYQLYLSLKQFYSRLGVEAFPDNEIQKAAIKELNKLLGKQKNTPIQKELEYITTERNMYHSQIEEVLDFIRNEGYDTFEEFKNYFEKLSFEYNDFFEQIKNKGTCGLCQYIDNKRIKELEQEVEEKKTRISELEDKDWYEGLIKQLEDQCDRLIREKENADSKLIDKEKENKNLKSIVDTFDKLKQYDVDAKQLVLINPDNIYANLDGQKLMLKPNKQTIIDELNKLREFISIKHKNKLALHKAGHLTEYGEGSATMCEIIMDEIDTQIQSLKGGTND